MTIALRTHSRRRLLFAALALAWSAGASAICREGIAPTTPDSELWNHKNGTIVDLETGLMWMRCSYGQTGEKCKGQALEYTWEEALALPSQVNESGGFAGHTDWRLPNFKELLTIVEHACLWPAINTKRFPRTGNAAWWTSSSGPTTSAIYVDFTIGETNFYPRDNMLRVRLVRQGQESAP